MRKKNEFTGTPKRGCPVWLDIFSQGGKADEPPTGPGNGLITNGPAGSRGFKGVVHTWRQNSFCQQEHKLLRAVPSHPPP